MWAIVEINKKQYKVKKGESLLVDRINKKGNIVLDKVLLFYKENKAQIGTPYLKNVKIKASIMGEKKMSKIIVYKYKRRKKYRRKRGHRQILTHLKISDIVESK